MERLTITGIGSEMQGIGRMGDGRTLFVPGALPGETVLAEVEKDAGRYCVGRLAEIIEPSPDRIDPDCPLYGKCGGCQIRHAAPDLALSMKRTRVTDALTRIAGLAQPNVLDTLPCEDALRYRNKAEYPFRNGRIGMFDESGKRILPVPDCLLQKEGSLRVLRFVEKRIRDTRGSGYLVTRVNRMGEIMAILSSDAPMPAWLSELSRVENVRSVYFCALSRRWVHALDGNCSLIWGSAALTETLRGMRFRISPQTFFQVNTAQAEKLYQTALEAASLRENSRALDAYCGCGTITLAAARYAGHALGVEIVPPAIADARLNAAENGLAQKTEFVCADAAREIPERMKKGQRFDCAIVDPPRKGCGAALLDALAEAAIPRIVYVSCDPGTLARDVKRLTEQGYRLEWAKPVDMFPGTAHVETVVLMSRA